MSYRRLGRIIGVSLALVLWVVGVLVPLGLSYLYVEALLGGPCNPPLPPSPPLWPPTSAQALTLTAQDGVQLEAWYIEGESSASILVMGGAYSHRDTLWREALVFHEGGYSVLMLESRSCAQPPHAVSLGYLEIQDVQAGLDWLEKRPAHDPARVGAFGFSAGGATVILTAAQDTRLRAVVAVGNYADMQADVYRGARFWRHPYEWWIRMWVGFFFEQRAGIRLEQNRPIAALPHISPRPVLLIHGANEVEPAQGWAQFASAGPPKALYIMPGAGHGDYMAVDSAAYSARLRLFFDTYLLGEKTVDG